MRYFQVFDKTIDGTVWETAVSQDGTSCSGPDVAEHEASVRLGYVVYEMDEDGTVTDSKFFPLNGRKPQDILDEIKESYPAGEWQNNDW